MRVCGFFDQYRFLSNFEGPGFWAGGEYWPTNEHYYQAMKSDDPLMQQTVRLQATPGKAKRVGRTILIRDDWEKIKDDVMRYGLFLKFQDPEARALLLGTGDAYLEETNTWGDTYWGVCEGLGQNRLGEMLMALRAYLRA